MCFLRLDFETFDIAGTAGSDNNYEGVCVDTFMVTVSANVGVFSPVCHVQGLVTSRPYSSRLDLYLYFDLIDLLKKTYLCR